MTIAFDLAPIDTKTASEEGRSLTIYNIQDSRPLEVRGQVVTIILAGPDSDAYYRAVSDNMRARATAAAEGKDVDERALRVHVLASCTLGWTGIFSPNGDVVPMTKAKAEELYLAVPVIADQAESFIVRRANFTPPLRAV